MGRADGRAGWRRRGRNVRVGLVGAVSDRTRVSVCCPECSHRFVATPEARFWGKVNPDVGEDDCWEWSGVLLANGYAIFQTNGTRVLAHRYSYELHVGPIPDGLVIDHLCRNKKCVNPEHLEPVTQAENARRGFSPPAVAARKDQCVRGHQYTLDNTRINARGWRSCKTCANSLRRARRKAQR
jgi:hypothetical protein